MGLKPFESHEYVVFLSIYFLIALRPLHATVIDPSDMLYFRQSSSTINTMWNNPASLLLYASWYLACPGEVWEDTIWCLPCSGPSVIRAAVPHFPLKYQFLTAMYVPSQRA